MKYKLKLFLITSALIYLSIILILGDRLHIMHSLILTAFMIWYYILLCMGNREKGVSKVFYIKDFCVLAIWNLTFLDYIKNRFMLYPIYILILGTGLYCLYYLYNVDNGYKKLNLVEEAQHAEWRDKFKGDKQMEDFFAPEEKEEGEDTFAQKGLKNFFEYMFTPCCITILRDVLEIIIGYIK